MYICLYTTLWNVQQPSTPERPLTLTHSPTDILTTTNFGPCFPHIECSMCCILWWGEVFRLQPHNIKSIQFNREMYFQCAWRICSCCFPFHFHFLNSQFSYIHILHLVLNAVVENNFRKKKKSWEIIMHIYTLLYWAHFYIHSNKFFFFETHRTNLWVTYHISFPFSQCLHAHWGKRVGSKEYLSPAICAPPWHLFTAVDYFSTFPLWARYIHTYIYCNFSSLFNFRVSFHPSTLKTARRKHT